jgi:hypothetical protein
MKMLIRYYLVRVVVLCCLFCFCESHCCFCGLQVLRASARGAAGSAAVAQSRGVATFGRPRRNQESMNMLCLQRREKEKGYLY